MRTIRIVYADWLAVSPIVAPMGRSAYLGW